MRNRGTEMYSSRVNGPDRKGPSFSSTLLEQICRSIDADDGQGEVACVRGKQQQQQNDAAKLLDKLVENRTKKNVTVENEYKSRPGQVADDVPSKKNAGTFIIDKKLHSIDSDPLFFSSGSNSSDSNSSLFSEHESIPLPTTKTRSSCFLPPKPIRVREKKKKKSDAKAERRSSDTEHDDDIDIPASAKSRALKLYTQLKKMKQPISPGVKLTTFINSILSSSSRKRSTCSSASSFTRTCLTTPSSTRTNSVKPVPAVNVKTAPHPRNRDEQEHLRLRPQLNRASAKPSTKPTLLERASEDAAAASDCSEDLFELEHLKLSINNGGGLSGDLPVFETTRISSCSRNRVVLNLSKSKLNV